MSERLLQSIIDQVGIPSQEEAILICAQIQKLDFSHFAINHDELFYFNSLLIDGRFNSLSELIIDISALTDISTKIIYDIISNNDLLKVIIKNLSDSKINKSEQAKINYCCKIRIIELYEKEAQKQDKQSIIDKCRTDSYHELMKNTSLQIVGLTQEDLEKPETLLELESIDDIFSHTDFTTAVEAQKDVVRNILLSNKKNLSVRCDQQHVHVKQCFTRTIEQEQQSTLLINQNKSDR